MLPSTSRRERRLATVSNRNPSAKTWCFTWNNYTDETEEKFKSLHPEQASFIVYGREVGSQETPHLQGTITFTRSRRLRGIRNLLGDGGHWEICRNVARSVEYCKKEGDYEQLGEYGAGRGRRTDLASGIEHLFRHRDLVDFRKQYPELWVKYPRGFSTLLDKEPRRKKPYVEWIYGPTGVGKTYSVFSREPDLWISSGGLTWWDGYYDQRAVLFDDYRGSHAPFNTLLRILDRYPYRCPIKGSTVPFTAARIYITSPYHPKDVYVTVEDVSQLLRRIDRIVHIPFPTVPANEESDQSSNDDSTARTVSGGDGGQTESSNDELASDTGSRTRTGSLDLIISAAQLQQDMLDESQEI